MRRQQSGQALTETLVAFVVLVPVFMLIPYLGKYLDDVKIGNFKLDDLAWMEKQLEMDSSLNLQLNHFEHLLLILLVHKQLFW